MALQPQINKCRHFETNQNIRKLPRQIIIKLFKVSFKQFNWKKNPTEFYTHYFEDLSSMLTGAPKFCRRRVPKIWLYLKRLHKCIIHLLFDQRIEKNLMCFAMILFAVFFIFLPSKFSVAGFKSARYAIFCDVAQATPFLLVLSAASG